MTNQHVNRVLDDAASGHLPPDIAGDHALLEAAFREAVRQNLAREALTIVPHVEDLSGLCAPDPQSQSEFWQTLRCLVETPVREGDPAIPIPHKTLRELALRAGPEIRLRQSALDSAYWAHGERDMRHAHLEGFGHPVKGGFIDRDFSYAALVGMHFNADATKSVFKNASITDFAARGSCFDEVDFSGAFFHNVEFKGVSLKGTRFCEVRVMRPSEFTSLRLIGCDMTGADFTNARVPLGRFDGEVNVYNETIFKGANIEGGTFRDTFFSGSADFRDANLRLVCFSSAYIRGTFANANLSDATFVNSNVTGVDFGGANLAKVSFAGAQVMGANFTRAAGLDSVKWYEVIDGWGSDQRVEFVRGIQRAIGLPDGIVGKVRAEVDLALNARGFVNIGPSSHGDGSSLYVRGGGVLVGP